jgi:hypothetical protein
MHPYFTISAFLMKVSTYFLEIWTMKIRRENDSLLHKGGDTQNSQLHLEYVYHHWHHCQLSRAIREEDKE